MTCQSVSAHAYNVSNFCMFPAPKHIKYTQPSLRLTQFQHFRSYREPDCGTYSREREHCVLPHLHFGIRKQGKRGISIKRNSGVRVCICVIALFLFTPNCHFHKNI